MYYIFSAATFASISNTIKFAIPPCVPVPLPLLSSSRALSQSCTSIPLSDRARPNDPDIESCTRAPPPTRVVSDYRCAIDLSLSLAADSYEAEASIRKKDSRAARYSGIAISSSSPLFIFRLVLFRCVLRRTRTFGLCRGSCLVPMYVRFSFSRFSGWFDFLILHATTLWMSRARLYIIAVLLSFRECAKFRVISQSAALSTFVL